MNLNLALHLKSGDAAQVLAKNLFLYFKLVSIISMLIVASAAFREIGAVGWDAMGGWRDDLFSARPHEARSPFSNRGIHFLFGKHEWNKHRFTAALRIVLIRIGWKASQAFPAIDQLFDGKKQEMILSQA